MSKPEATAFCTFVLPLCPAAPLRSSIDYSHTLFHSSKRRRVEAEFTGAEVTSNGGALLLAEADRRMGLTRAAAKAMGDDRRRKSVVHSTLAIVRQRVHALALCHEDLNDRGALRRDPALQANRRFVIGKLRFPQAAAGRDGELASPSTLCRFERKSGPAEAAALHELLDGLKGNASVDWQHREPSRARMRVLVKRILRKHGYPPDLQDAAVRTVLQQAEALSTPWAVG